MKVMYHRKKIDSDVPQKKAEVSSGESCVVIGKSEESGGETEESVQEMKVEKPKPVEIVLNSDNEVMNSSSPNTEDIYADEMDLNRSKISQKSTSICPCHCHFRQQMGTK